MYANIENILPNLTHENYVEKQTNFGNRETQETIDILRRVVNKLAAGRETRKARVQFLRVVGRIAMVRGRLITSRLGYRYLLRPFSTSANRLLYTFRQGPGFRP